MRLPARLLALAAGAPAPSASAGAVPGNIPAKSLSGAQGTFVNSIVALQDYIFNRVYRFPLVAHAKAGRLGGSSSLFCFMRSAIPLIVHIAVSLTLVRATK